MVNAKASTSVLVVIDPAATKVPSAAMETAKASLAVLPMSSATALICSVRILTSSWSLVPPENVPSVQWDLLFWYPVPMIGPQEMAERSSRSPWKYSPPVWLWWYRHRLWPAS